MDKIEKFIRERAVYSSHDYAITDISEFLQKYELERKYEGQMSRVYKVVKESWVIKEWKWDIKLELMKPGIPIPAKFFDKLFDKMFSFKFLPKQEEVLRQYKLFLEFIQYLGFFESNKDFYHPNRELMNLTQRQIRKSLLFFKDEIEEKYEFKIDSSIEEVLNDEKIIYHNFIPKEYLLIANSISPENKGQPTSMIFQEFVKGKLLYDIADKDLKPQFKKQLVLMIYLILLMNLQTGIVPDTRPRYSFLQANNWLTKTDNIIVSNDGLKFIDTRWFWDTNKFSMLVLPTVIPKLVIQKAKTSINSLLAEI